MYRVSPALLALLFLPWIAYGQSPPDSGAVVINELRYAPPDGDTEFVELYNRSEMAVNLAHLEIADATQDYTAVADADTLLPSGEYVVLVRDADAFASTFPNADYLAPSDWPILNNTGDTSLLRHAPSGTTIDAVAYESSWGGTEGPSLERIDPAGPSTHASNFGTSEAEAGATPGVQNSIFNPDTTPPVLVDAQPTVTGDSVIAHFSEPVDPSTMSASALQLDGPSPPAIAAATVSDTAASAVQARLDGELSEGTYTLRALNVADLQENVRDETQASFFYFDPDPPTPTDLVVTEILYAPAGNGTEFVEIYNRSEKTVDLGMLALADRRRDFHRVTASRTPLRPDSHAIVVRDTAAFAAAFPDVEAHRSAGWAALNNGGDTVILQYAPSGTELDAVPYDPSWGGGDGTSLERIDPAGPSDRADNFGSSMAAAGATPAARNSIYAPDTTAPTLQTVRPTLSGDSLVVRFSEPVDPATITAAGVRLASPDAPTTAVAAVSDTSAATVHVRLSAPLSDRTYTLVATDVSDRRGNVRPEAQASFQYFSPEAPASRDLVITEILYAPRDGGSEFIEIYNRSEKTVDLGALAVADEDRDFRPFAPRLTPLRPDSHAVIVRAPNAFSATFPGVTHWTPEAWGALNNGGDTVRLRHAPSQTTIDEVPYASSWGGGNSRSLERIDPAGPSGEAFNFATATADDGATPGRRNSRYAPDETAPTPVFAEQVAETKAHVPFSEPLQASSITAAAFALETTTVTQATLARDSVAVLTLDGSPSDKTVRVAGVQDRVGNTLDATTLPLALRPDSGMVVINEILFDPRADDFDDRPNQVEYVELLNRTDHPLSLHDLFLTDRPTENGTADTLRSPRRVALPPGGYGIVAAAPHGTPTADSSQLARAFPDAPLSADSAAYLPVDAARLGLGNDGDLVRLHRADGTVLTDIAYSPDWHAAGLEKPKGTALERISPTGGTEAADNWTSSPTPAGGTPGARNAVALPTADAPTETGLTIAPSPFSIERDGATRIQYTLDGVPNLVRARIFDARGRKVRTLEDARLTGATGELVWNGRNDAGNRVRVGVYVVLFEAVRAKEGVVSEFKAPVVVARPLD